MMWLIIASGSTECHDTPNNNKFYYFIRNKKYCKNIYYHCSLSHPLAETRENENKQQGQQTNSGLVAPSKIAYFSSTDVVVCFVFLELHLSVVF